jgi:hypothetical protein
VLQDRLDFLSKPDQTDGILVERAASVGQPFPVAVVLADPVVLQVQGVLAADRFGVPEQGADGIPDLKKLVSG